MKVTVGERIDDPKTPVEALEWMSKEKTINMTLLTPDGSKRYDVDPQAGNGPNRAIYFPISFDWQSAEGSYVKNSPMTLMLISRSRDFSLHFFEGSNLVLLRTDAQDKWFAAMPKDDPNDVFYQDVFQFMRVWYDEAEYSGLTADIRVPDMGQSQEVIAKAWVDAYEGAKTKATPEAKSPAPMSGTRKLKSSGLTNCLRKNWTASIQRTQQDMSGLGSNTRPCLSPKTTGRVLV